MNNHVNAVCKSIHYHIRALRHILSSISEDMAKMVACALVGSRLDYANSVPVFENTYFSFFSDFKKKHDFLRFFLNDISKSRKKSSAKV